MKRRLQTGKKARRRLRVVILTTKLPEDIWMVNTLADVCRVEGVVLPLGTRYREYGAAHVIGGKLRNLDIAGLANQALLLAYRRIFESQRDGRAAREIFSGKSSHHVESPDIDMLEVDNINSEKVRDYLISKAPEVVIVSGAPLLKRLILDATPGRIINLHPGLAPQYRGRYGCFWPVVNGEPELVGTTVHFIDSGIDTGKILIQKRVDFEPDDTLKEITYKQHREGTNLIVKCLQDFGTYTAAAYHRADCPSRNYRALGLTQYLRGKRWLKAKAAVRR